MELHKIKASLDSKHWKMYGSSRAILFQKKSFRFMLGFNELCSQTEQHEVKINLHVDILGNLLWKTASLLHCFFHVIYTACYIEQIYSAEKDCEWKLLIFK